MKSVLVSYLALNKKSGSSSNMKKMVFIRERIGEKCELFQLKNNLPVKNEEGLGQGFSENFPFY